MSVLPIYPCGHCDLAPSRTTDQTPPCDGTGGSFHPGEAMGKVIALREDGSAADASFDAWLGEGHELAQRAESLQWEIGDWWATGEHAYGDMTRVAVELFAGRYSYASLAQFAKVSRAIQPYNRFPNLTWSHHHYVAALEDAEQLRMLKRAEDHDWNIRELREAVDADYERHDPHRPRKGEAPPKRKRREQPIESTSNQEATNDKDAPRIDANAGIAADIYVHMSSMLGSWESMAAAWATRTDYPERESTRRELLSNITRVRKHLNALENRVKEQ